MSDYIVSQPTQTGKDDGLRGRPRGPNGLALVCRDSIVKLEAELEIATTMTQKRGLRRRLKLCRDMERWCKTRAGYVTPGKETA